MNRIQPCEAAYFNRAIDWQELGNLENAIQDFKRFIELCPDDPTAHEYLAVVYAEAKTLSSNYPHLALEHARAALELTEGKACSAFLSLASSYAALNEFSLAVENQRRAIEISEQDTDVPVVLSILKQRLQEYLKLLETS